MNATDAILVVVAIAAFLLAHFYGVDIQLG